MSEWLGEDFELGKGEGVLVVSLEELVPTPRVTGDDIKKSSAIPNKFDVCDEEPNKAGGTRCGVFLSVIFVFNLSPNNFVSYSGYYSEYGESSRRSFEAPYHVLAGRALKCMIQNLVCLNVMYGINPL